jgi:hypothetical protein
VKNIPILRFIGILQDLIASLYYYESLYRSIHINHSMVPKCYCKSISKRMLKLLLKSVLGRKMKKNEIQQYPYFLRKNTLT